MLHWTLVRGNQGRAGHGSARRALPGTWRRRPHITHLRQVKCASPRPSTGSEVESVNMSPFSMSHTCISFTRADFSPRGITLGFAERFAFFFFFHLETFANPSR